MRKLRTFALNHCGWTLGGKARGGRARGVVALATVTVLALASAPAAQAERTTPGDIPVWLQASEWANDPHVPLVVFGARLNEDCSAPAVMGERLDKAAMFTTLHPRTPIIVTGGATRAGCPTESNAMRTGLLMRGVKNPIIEETHAQNTLENAKNVAGMWGGARMVVCTSNDHAERASRNLQHEGKQTVALTLGA